MTTREQFIGAARAALGHSEPSVPTTQLTYRHSVHTDVMKDLTQNELADYFIEYSKCIGADVYETSKMQLKQTILHAISHCTVGDIVLADDPLLTDLNLADELGGTAQLHIWNTSKTWDENVSFAEKATVGIAVARIALAESGTVLLFSQGGSGRSVTLLPESTIYIIPKSRIKPRLTQGMAYVRENKEQLPSSVNFVSGPSATSDIELVRVVGVHGPVHVVHIVVDDL